MRGLGTLDIRMWPLGSNGYAWPISSFIVLHAAALCTVNYFIFICIFCLIMSLIWFTCYGRSGSLCSYCHITLSYQECK